MVRRSFERFNANDIDGLLELMDPEVQFHDVPEIPGSTVKEPLEKLRFEWVEVTEGTEKLATPIMFMPTVALTRLRIAIQSVRNGKNAEDGRGGSGRPSLIVPDGSLGCLPFAATARRWANATSPCADLSAVRSRPAEAVAEVLGPIAARTALVGVVGTSRTCRIPRGP